LQVFADALEGLAVDHRADIGGQLGRVARHQLLRRALDHLDHAVGDAFVHAQQAQAEQRWPAERNALCTTASTTCSGRAVLSTTMALMPPVSAISGTMARPWPPARG
jgi:hypothetical protein